MRVLLVVLVGAVLAGCSQVSGPSDDEMSYFALMQLKWPQDKVAVVGDKVSLKLSDSCDAELTHDNVSPDPLFAPGDYILEVLKGGQRVVNLMGSSEVEKFAKNSKILEACGELTGLK